MENNNSNLPFKAEEVVNILQTAPSVLQRNEASVSACNNAGKSLLDTIEGNGGITTDELDTTVQSYLEKTKITSKNLNNRRKALTQMLTAISRKFTSLENAIDVKDKSTIPGKLQDARNKYAAAKLAEQKRREEEARRIQLAENEKNQYKSDLSLMLETGFANYVGRHINALQGIYARATFATFGDAYRNITQANTEFNWMDFAKNITDNIPTYYMDANTRLGIKKEVSINKKKEFTERYSFELEGVKQDLISKLPSLKAELEEQEELRRTNAAEAAKMQAEREKRAAAERKAIEEEKRKREEEAKAKAEAEKAQADMQAAFDFSAASMTSTPAKAKVKKKIEITNVQGFMQVYQMWFMNEAVNMSMEDLKKAHKKMITYCEKVANKEGEMIKSGFVKYVDDVTAK